MCERSYGLGKNGFSEGRMECIEKHLVSATPLKINEIGLRKGKRRHKG